MNQIQKQLTNSTVSNFNVILLIIATSFLFSGEKILTRFWNLSIDTSERTGIKSMIGKPRKILGHLKGPK